MAPTNDHLWKRASRQHGVLSRAQLLSAGLSKEAVAHRIATGRLHPVAGGVYAVGRPELSRHGLWMAAVLSCGPDAVLSHESAAALWGILPPRGEPVAVTVPPHLRRRRPGVVVHRRGLEAAELTTRHDIPATEVRRTLLDLACVLDRDRLEGAINAADKLDLTDPERLRAALDGYARRPGVAALRAVLDNRTFALTDSQLERLFLAIVRRLGLPQPETGARLNGFKVDFHWPNLGLVVETDGLRYHRTAVQQTRDRLRDQAHAAAGLTPLRFTYAQVRHEPDHVAATLAAVVARQRRSPERMDDRGGDGPYDRPAEPEAAFSPRRPRPAPR